VVTKEKPRKAYCLYFSLDDAANELLPRFIAIDQNIPINAVRFPKKYQDDVRFMEKREIGMGNLRHMTNHFGLMDVNSGSSIEFIEETSKKYALDLAAIDETYQLVIFIDNFHDITVDSIKFGSDNNAKYDYLADQLSRIGTTLDAPIICTAEFRKLNGNRRPKLDDIRETVKIIYEAKAIFLCYNEVGLRGQQSGVYWQDAGADAEEKQPIYEMHIGKNKFGSFKGRLFYEFRPAYSMFREVPQAGAMRYSQMISS
jgi:replicative DNA helicase